MTPSRPPSLPAEFEVADIKPSAPGARAIYGIQAGGRVNLQGYTLKLLILLAWNLDSDDKIIGGPKWLNSDRFDIVAKASTSVPASDLGIDDVRRMLQALLANRFQLTTHMEDRDMLAYTLVALKPKLNKADPTNRAGCKEGPAPDAKDPRDTNPMLARLVTCRSMSMAEFAEELPRIGREYIHSPVVDATGIEGAWDFTLNFSPFISGQFRRW
jgi:uncharacterized protein (TIGR03435 family)